MIMEFDLLDIVHPTFQSSSPQIRVDLMEETMKEAVEMKISCLWAC